MSPGMRNERKVRKGSTMSCRCLSVNALVRVVQVSTHHQLCFPTSDVKGSFTLNKPGVHPDLCTFVLLNRPETKACREAEETHSDNEREGRRSNSRAEGQYKGTLDVAQKARRV
jgi:hypothetical protein